MDHEVFNEFVSASCARNYIHKAQQHDSLNMTSPRTAIIDISKLVGEMPKGLNPTKIYLQLRNGESGRNSVP